ncbi:MAG: hypothetical protein AAF990_00555 [Bacteroidota bacterium]
MATKYKIYLVNLQASSKKFWCFLDQPIQDLSGEVYANSSAFLTVPPFNPAQTNSFTIPLQYKVAVGASNKAVKLNTLVQSDMIFSTDLEKKWKATYTQDGHNVGPVLASDGSAGLKTVVMDTNQYDKSKEPINSWYGSMTFGIESENGFIGQTWSPDPLSQYTIVPKVNFYVATGNFQSSRLADINEISLNSANITAQSFDFGNECTVTLNSDGSWDVSPGKPNASLMHMSRLMDTHQTLVQIQEKFVNMVSMASAQAAPALALAGYGPEETERRSKGITINKSKSKAADTDGFLTGTITVGTAVGLGFAYIISAGITLDITYRRDDGLRFDFKYNGAASREALQQAFAAGKELLFLGR